MVALLSLFGCLVFRRFVAPGGEAPASVRLATLSAWLTLVLGFVWFAAVAATIAGTDGLVATSRVLPVVASRTSFGHLVGARLLLLVVAVPLLRSQAAWAGLAALLVTAAALATQPLLGHFGALGDAVLIAAEMAHLLAAGAWLGGLAPLFLYLRHAAPASAQQASERFSPVGLVAVGTIALTALPQAGDLVGGLPGLFGTPYGRLALLKLGLFALALALAGMNRLVLTPRLLQADARRWLRLSIVAEGVLGLAIVFAAAAMASSPPGAHAQPVWPFASRFSAAAWADPAVSEGLTRLMITAAIGAVLIVASLLARRGRILALCVALALVGRFVPTLGSLLVDAWPTSYARSPEGFTEESIVNGQALFQRQCAVCHEPADRTGGPADLLASHVWRHLDGELFWWIRHGLADAKGDALMPAFATMLSEDDVWSLVDFIRARSIGAQAATGSWSPPIAAPETPLICATGDATSLAGLRGRVLLFVAGADAPADGAEGATVARIARGRAGAPRPGECVTASSTAWEGWAVLAGVPGEKFLGYRGVVDARGWLRAWLPPNAPADALRAAITDARDRPIVLTEPAAAAHRH